jgi:DNA-directed RNA polymerase subunit RPC12/RpoP
MRQITFQCDRCRKAFHYPINRIAEEDKRIPCPHCKEDTVIPAFFKVKV